MQVLRSWRWSVTLVTLLQGQGVQMENFPFVQDMGVRVVMMSGATVITSRGEISAALETLPKVDMFFVFQTFRSNHIVAPIAILRPFQVHARIIVFNTDMHSLRLVSRSPVQHENQGADHHQCACLKDSILFFCQARVSEWTLSSVCLA